MKMTPRVIVKKLIRRWSISSSARCCNRHALLMISWFTTMSQKNVSDNGSDWCSDTTRREDINNVTSGVSYFTNVILCVSFITNVTSWVSHFISVILWVSYLTNVTLCVSYFINVTSSAYVCIQVWSQYGNCFVTCL